LPRAILERLIATPAPPADARLAYGPDPLNFGDLRLPKGEGPHPIVVVVHGGRWLAQYNLEFMGHQAAALTARGVATWNVEFRRVGNSGGGWPGTFHDVAAALDYLREIAPRYRLDLGRLVVTGHSSGGHLALWLAGRRRISAGDPLYSPSPLPVQAVVSVAGVGDLEHPHLHRDAESWAATFLGATPSGDPARYATGSPANLLPLGVRQVIVHGTADPIAPYALGADYHARAVAAGDDAVLVPIPDAAHFAVIDPASEAGQVVIETILAETR
jgi:acetyl esterase/lipase